MGVASLLWVVLPMAFYGLLAMCLPPPGPPPRWRARLRNRRTAAGDRWERWRNRNAPSPEPDPFAALRLQLRLADLAAQVRVLESDTRVWARARRLEAVQVAYDGLLTEACRLAGVAPEELEITAPRRLTEPERFDEELALVQAGWSW